LRVLNEAISNKSSGKLFKRLIMIFFKFLVSFLNKINLFASSISKGIPMAYILMTTRLPNPIKTLLVLKIILQKAEKAL
jgi:hypothetical protein